MPENNSSPPKPKVTWRDIREQAEWKTRAKEARRLQIPEAEIEHRVRAKIAEIAETYKIYGFEIVDDIPTDELDFSGQKTLPLNPPKKQEGG